ncbi:FAD-dependent oxidoreductase [Pseudonocardia eucalypti]|uniref:FAD-dependent oxidoreductase n=1 Tax=Pseudonocardia eucalypti TaxID=648755 RepID=A0ABP9QHD3_9PSEU|nr:monoamine oxidase [Pseudonocardia eucalypti]
MSTVDHEVIVVGAGAAGLRAATSLRAAGCDVVCLEARDRVGGRLLSVPTTAGVLDLGATWFWAGEQRVTRLARESGAAPFRQHLAGDTIFQDGGGVRRLGGNLVDGPAQRFGRGAARIATAMAHTLPPDTVRLGCPVRSVRSADPHSLAVDTDDALLRARHVVIAVPPALAVARIDFAGQLPDPLVGLARATPVWMGAITKVVAVYERPFWRDAGLAGAGLSRLGPLQEIHDMCGPGDSPAALFGFAPPLSADIDLEAAVIGQLNSMFGEHAARPVRLIAQDWRREAWTSPPGVEALVDYHLFGHPVFHEPELGGRLHWACTETAAGFGGHIEGALASGDAAAAAILAAEARTPHTTRPTQVIT